MTREEVLELYFIAARSNLIEIAAFLDRIERAEGADDYRVQAYRKALQVLQDEAPEKAKRTLLVFSDPTTEPIPAAPGKGATGAWPGLV